MSDETTRTYAFVLLLDGGSAGSASLSEIEDALANAGCTDALLGLRNGVTYLDFDRQADSADAAVSSAIRQVELAGIGVRVIRVEPDDIVSQAEIARRTGRTRETIRLWSEGARGTADFPRPCSGLTSRSLRWRWVEVARWLAEHEKLDDPSVLPLAETIARINGALDFREHRLAYLEELGRMENPPRP